MHFAFEIFHQVSLVFVSWTCPYMLQTIPLAVSSREPMERKQTLRVCPSTTSFHFWGRAAIYLSCSKVNRVCYAAFARRKSCAVQSPLCSTIWFSLNKADQPVKGLHWAFSDDKIIQFLNLDGVPICADRSQQLTGNLLDSNSIKPCLNFFTIKIN